MTLGQRKGGKGTVKQRSQGVQEATALRQRMAHCVTTAAEGTETGASWLKKLPPKRQGQY